MGLPWVKTLTQASGITNLTSFNLYMSEKSILVFSGSPMIIPLICQTLSKEKIFPIIKDEAESARLAGFGVNSYEQKVFVNKNEAERALRIIKSLNIKS